MSHYLHESQGLSRRTVALAGIVGLHMLIIYLFATGLVMRIVPVPPQDITATVERVVREPPAFPPPHTDVTLTKVTFTDVTKVPRIDLAPEDPPLGGIDLPPLQLPPDPPRIPEDPIRVVGQNRLPNTDEYYPPGLIREGIQGAAIVRSCVDEKGNLRGDPMVEQSSGNARLDNSALSVARAGHYARSVRGTTPVPNCFRIRIGFQLR
jgi:TonB family protein